RDLVNTRDLLNGTDSLAAADGLAAFAHDHGLTGLALAKRDLPDVIRLREWLRAACLAHAGVPMPRKTADGPAEPLRRAPLVVVLDRAGEARLVPADGLTGVAALTARIAAAVATAAADGTWPRLKACEASDCRWAYYDRSPAGRRRWCAMSVCGSRAKMRAYRARRSSGNGGTEERDVPPSPADPR
ncbi:MAG TPA: CGNR zinc finger domain-containing protein, partial [Streptomyces sp.]|nr:CGNR zinc finger domain-containing protein [Streptomyces sp.]